MNPPPQKKSRLWIILGILLVALVIGVGTGVFFGTKFLTKAVAARTERRAKLAELEKQRRELLDAAKNSVETGSPDGAADRLSKFGDSIGNAAESLNGIEKQGLRVAQRILQSMAPAVSAYEVAFRELQTANVLGVDTIDSKDAIASRVVVIKKFDEANENLVQLVKNLEPRIRAELEKEGFPKTNRDEFVNGFLKSANVDLTLTVRQCDTDLAAAMQKIMALLDREWGAWKAENGAINFNRVPATEEYNGLISKIDELGERQATAQQELLKRTGKAAPLR